MLRPMAVQDLARLPGLGPTSAGWLVEVGVESMADIDRLGSVAIYRRLRLAREGITPNMLYALESLVLGCHWRDLPAERKAALRVEVAEI